MASLRDLGLSEYEARAYRSLLRTGPTTAKELSRTSEVPMGRIYDVLNGLEQHRLVRSQAAGRPKKYVAVEPEVALDRLLASKKEELNAKAKQYESVVDTLVEEMDGGEPVDEQFWTAAVGPDETLDLLCERIAAAEDELIYVAGSPASGIDLREASSRLTTALEAALERGVDIELLLTSQVLDALPDQNVVHHHSQLAEYDNFAVRTLGTVDWTFTLLDRIEVCIAVPNPMEPSQSFAMIDLKDTTFASDLREEFHTRWEQAEPLDV